jgi:hypothetical protein
MSGCQGICIPDVNQLRTTHKGILTSVTAEKLDQLHKKKQVQCVYKLTDDLKNCNYLLITHTKNYLQTSVTIHDKT